MTTLRFLGAAIAAAAVNALLLTAGSQQSEAGKLLYLDSTQPIDKRVEDLLRRMTFSEKIGQFFQLESGSGFE